MPRSPSPSPAGRPSDPTGTLSSYRYGRFDPTTRLLPGEFWRATLTPFGPATVHLDWREGAMRTEAWGDGADWLAASVPGLVGHLDQGHVFTTGHPALLRAQHHHPGVHFGSSGTLYHELIPTVLGQRVTGGEGLQQWWRLVQRLGRPAPGPAGLTLPPDPATVLEHPSWWFHQLGVETKRAEAVRTVARHADRMFDWALLPHPSRSLALLPGIGQWTIGSVLAHAVGDPDAVAVGDYHLKNIITHAFTGRPRGTDEEMLELLAPYEGQRGRVCRLLLLDGHRAPKFGPRQRIIRLNRR